MLANDTRSCADLSPANLLAAVYYVVAVDRDATGDLREGDAKRLPILAAIARPLAPRGPLQGSRTDGVLTLDWTAPLIGSPIFYRIYRDGLAIGDRYDRTNSPVTTWSAPRGSDPHDYWVTAVDARYNESDPIGPVR